jgi:hypothetical protein
MNLRRILACAALGVLGACSKPDPLQDPEYAAACHGLPLDAPGREKAQQEGYVLVARFGCIDRNSWDEVQRAHAMVADLERQATRQIKEADALPGNLAQARTRERRSSSSARSTTCTPPPTPWPNYPTWTRLLREQDFAGA